MARKLPVFAARTQLAPMTPNQFMTYKMTVMHASLICRLGHYSLGFLGTGWSDRTATFEHVTELVAQREYKDLGWESIAEQLVRCPSLKGHVQVNYRGTFRVEHALDDLGGRHPLDAELRAECAVIRAQLEPHI